MSEFLPLIFWGFCKHTFPERDLGNSKIGKNPILNGYKFTEESFGNWHSSTEKLDANITSVRKKNFYLFTERVLSNRTTAAAAAAADIMILSE